MVLFRYACEIQGDGLTITARAHAYCILAIYAFLLVTSLRVTLLHIANYPRPQVVGNSRETVASTRAYHTISVLVL